MGHDHAHHHDHRPKSRRRLLFTLMLTASYMVAEVVGGLVTGSLALLADAGHMLSDVVALALALFAMWVSQRPPDAKATFGYHRTEILAALANGAALFAISGYILVEAYQRFVEPPQVRGGLMLLIAAGGLLVNIAALFILREGRHDSLNMRGAFLHVLSDALGSLGAMISGLLILQYQLHWADPAASVLIALLVLHSAWQLLKETVAVLMEGAPPHVDVEKVRDALASFDAVAAVHDLHVWTLTSDKVCMSAHVVTKTGIAHQPILRELTELMRADYGIHHVTLQMEDEAFVDHQCDDCGMASTVDTSAMAS